MSKKVTRLRVDNMVIKENLEKFMIKKGITYTISEVSGHWIFDINATEAEVTAINWWMRLWYADEEN